jgi:hypothetical protein
MTVVLVQFKPAARIPLAAPSAANSDASDSDASAEAKSYTDREIGSEIKEDERALLPRS